MNICPLPVALVMVLTAFATTAAFSQNVSAPARQEALPPPQIDPAALNLLARVSEKYSEAWSYRGVTHLAFGLDDGREPRKIRFRVYASYDGDVNITRVDKQGTAHYVYDGRKLLITYSRYPREYVQETIRRRPFMRESLLARAGYRSVVGDMLSQRFVTKALSPLLRSISVLPDTVQNGETLQRLEIVAGRGAQRAENASITLYITAGGLLRRAETVETQLPDRRIVWREDYSETELGQSRKAYFKGEPTDATSLLKTTPPAGYHLSPSPDIFEYSEFQMAIDVSPLSSPKPNPQPTSRPVPAGAPDSF